MTQLIDRQGMKADLLEMAERALHESQLEGRRARYGNYSRWADLYIFAENCRELAAELSREEGE